MADLEITFLGTGTSTGVPIVGCRCKVCCSKDPRDTRTRSSLYVRSPECSWVIDTGNDFRHQCLRENINQVDAVVYTHSHTDHVMGFDDLRPFCGVERPIPIHAAPETLADLKRIFEFAFNGKNRWPGYIQPEPQVIEGPFELGQTLLTPIRLKHGRAHVFGYVFTRGGQRLFAYLCDCKEVPEEALKLLVGTRVLVLDAVRYAPHPTHMNVEEALAFSERIGPEQTWFTHISHELGHEHAERQLPKHVRLAYDGLKLSL